MTNQKRLNYINHHNLNITEHTVINVDPAQLLDDPTDPTLYIDDLTTNIYLVLSSSDGQQLATGDFDDLISYIDAHIADQTK